MDHVCSAKRCITFVSKVCSKKDPINRVEYNLQYRMKHNEKIECECGAIVKELSSYAPLKSKRHADFIQQSATQGDD